MKFCFMQLKALMVFYSIIDLIYVIFTRIISSLFRNFSSIFEMATADAENIWFDGVDKKLIEMNSIIPTLIEGNDRTLITKTPLATFSSFEKIAKKKRKKEIEGKRTSTNSKIKGEKKKSVKVKDEKSSTKDTIKPNTGVTEELAMDCEMVECYHHKSVLARVSIVNLFGHPILDRYVAPPSKVTDYRTRWSGIRKKDLAGAPDFESVQKEVANLIKDRIVVGHAIHNDFSVLKINHPADKTRDTSVYYKYLFQGKTPSLKKLSECILGVRIQKGEHDSVQDAQATMKLYVKERDKWNEKLMASAINHNQSTRKKQKVIPKKKKVKTFYVMTS